MSDQQRPAPLVPAEVSMGANEWFPLYFKRLRKSRWWRRASDLARARNVIMWGAAYESTPAGSLPDDDDELAEAAGYGFDVATFLTHKAEIMAPWTLCSDDRWYHPTVCEVVLEGWERLSDKRKQARERQQNRRLRLREQTQTAAPASEGVTRDVEPVTRDTGAFEREPATQDRTGQDKQTVASAPPLSAVDGGRSEKALADRSPWRLDTEFLTFWDMLTPQSRRRSPMKDAWRVWRDRRKTSTAAMICGAYRAYRKDDPDVQRTGGPGAHIWLRDKLDVWLDASQPEALAWNEEQWAAAVGIWLRDAKWDDLLGPCPGQPGCRVPVAVLKAAGIGPGLSVVGGAA